MSAVTERSPILLVASLAAIALMPVMLVDIPAMVDYPNHLSRMYLMAAAGDPNPFYEVAWRLYPNLAMDIIVPPVAQLVGVEFASKLFLLLSQLLIITGAIAFEYSVKGRHELSGFAALICLYSLPFTFGFLNFQFALGLALWGLAAAQRLRARLWPVRLLVHSGVTAALFFGHLFALGLYLFVLGLSELATIRRHSQPEQTIGNLIVLAIPAVAMILIMTAGGEELSVGPTEWKLVFKLVSLFTVLNGYSILFAAVSAAVLIVLIYALVRTGAIRLMSTGIWLSAGMLVLFLAMPWRLVGTAYVDVRVIPAALLIVPAYAELTTRALRLQRAAAIFAVFLIVVNAGISAAMWVSYQPEYARIKQSFAGLDRPSRILIARSSDPREGDLLYRPIHHAPTLAVAKQAFVPTLFALATPIRVADGIRHLSITDVMDYGTVRIDTLRSLAHGRTPHDDVPRFLRHWTREFDYLYVVGPRIANPLPHLLQEIAHGDRFVMYAIGTRATTQTDWEQQGNPVAPRD